MINAMYGLLHIFSLGCLWCHAFAASNQPIKDGNINILSTQVANYTYSLANLANSDVILRNSGTSVAFEVADEVGSRAAILAIMN